jgi:regulatory protein
MAASRPAVPVAAAAEWLRRQGIAVPGADGSADAPASAELGQLADRRHARWTRARQEEPAAGAGEPAPHPHGDTETDPDGDAEADPYTVARSIALDRIAERARTRHQLAQALKSRSVPPDVAEQVLDRLQEVGLVDDAAFAEAWVESRQQRRHLSRPALRRELQGKGVDREQIDAALESVDHSDELGAARELARRRHAAIAGLPYAVRYRRLAGVLSRRGFGSGIVSQVLGEVLGEE